VDAEGCDFLILLFDFEKPGSKIAAFGSSYRRLGVGSWRVGCQAAFAGKPAPTVGLEVVSWKPVGP
jgi:hypothetical protein